MSSALSSSTPASGHWNRKRRTQLGNTLIAPQRPPLRISSTLTYSSSGIIRKRYAQAKASLILGLHVPHKVAEALQFLILNCSPLKLAMHG